jgi:hypothetical protein
LAGAGQLTSGPSKSTAEMSRLVQKEANKA